MRTIFILISVILALSVRVSAQDTLRPKDRVYMEDGDIYDGYIVQEKKGDHIVMETGQGTTLTLYFSAISRIEYRPGYTPQTTSPKESTGAPRKANEEEPFMTFDGTRASPKITSKMVRKRNTGIGLTIGGAGLIAVGAILLAKSPSVTTNNVYGGTTTIPSVGELAGVLMIVGGVGITIPGALLWGRNAAKIRKAQNEM